MWDDPRRTEARRQQISKIHSTNPLYNHSKTYPHPALALWAPALRLRAASLACMALAVPTLVARVVTLQQYCRMEGKVAEKEPAPVEDGSSSSELFKVSPLCGGWSTPSQLNAPPNPTPTHTTQACATGHVGANAAAMAVAYTLLGVLTLQGLSHLLALARWQHQQQHGLRAAHARRRQAAARAAQRALSHDGHTPPGCPAQEGEEGLEGEEWVEFWPPEQEEEDAVAGGGLLYYPPSYYAPPPPLFPPFASKQQQRQGGGGGGRQPRTPARQKGGSQASAGTTSFGSSSLASSSPNRYQALLHPNRWVCGCRGGKGSRVSSCLVAYVNNNNPTSHVTTSHQTHRALPTLSSSAANSSYYQPPGPGVSAAAAATARTLYGDVEQYDEPAPSIMVHAHHNGGYQAVSSPSQEDGADGAGGGGAEQGQGQGDSAGAYTGGGGPLTLSSGGQASAFSSYAAATTSTMD